MGKKGRRSAVVGVAVCATLAFGAGIACTSFSGEPDAADGGGPGPDGAGPTAPGADAGGAGDGDPSEPAKDAGLGTRGCAAVDATFCDDFDDGAPLSKRWATALDGDASISLSDAYARSAPNSLRVVSSGSQSYGAVVSARVPTFTDQFFMSFDVLFVVAPTNGNFLLQSQLTPTAGDSARNDSVGPSLVAFPPDNPKDGVELRAWNWSSNETRGFFLANVPLLTWVHIETSIRPATAGTSTVSFVVNGVPQQRTVPSEARTEVTVPAIFLGGRSGGSLLELYYDNVVIDAH